MNKLKTFARTYYRTISDPTYYRDVLQAKLSFSLKYFFLFYFILGITGTLVYNFRAKPYLLNLASQTTDEIQQLYPGNLVINFTDNKLVLQGEQSPVTIRFPESLKSESVTHEYQSLLTLNDTTDEASPSMFTLGQTQLTLLYPDGQEQKVSYADLEIGNQTINQSTVESRIPEIKMLLKGLVQLSPFAVFLVSSIFTPIMMLGVLFLLSGLVYIATQISQLRLSYRQAYQLSLHTITFAETASFLQRILFWNFDLPSIFSLAFFGATFLALWSLRPKVKKS